MSIVKLPGSAPAAPAEPNGQKVLMLVAGWLNYYYDEIGKRVADALRNLGFTVDVATLKEVKDQEYDWCFCMNIYDVCYSYVSYGDAELGSQRLAQVLKRCHHSAALLLEQVSTYWYMTSWKLLERLKIEYQLDLGFHNQYVEIGIPASRDCYHFVFNGLSAPERAIAQRWLEYPGERPIPWTFVGHYEPVRLKFAKELLDSIHPSGFVYLPELALVSEDGPHMNLQHMQATLERTRYYIWRSYHPYFYMESERFRSALLAGAVPIKVTNTALLGDRYVPFRNLMLDDRRYAEILKEMDFEETRRHFIEEFLSLPALEDELRLIFWPERVRYV